MLFKKKICPFCKASYDEALESCPHCHTVDENYPKEGSRVITWLPFFKQLILFGVGFAGLQILSSFIAIIFRGLNLDSVGYVAAVNYSTYFLLIVGLLLIVFKDLKYLMQSWKKGFSYMFGFLYGIALIVASVIYSTLINSLIPISDNANQSAVVAITERYPLLSILVLGIIGPVCEELTYRVGLYSFGRRINMGLAFVITFIVFAFIHFDFTSIGTDTFINELLNLPNYAIAGVLLCLAYETNGFAGSCIAHMTNNLYSVILIIIAAKLNG